MTTKKHTALARYSIGMGDRFGLQGVAQARAVQQAETEGVVVTPVWNKSNREHQLVGTQPADVRREADAAVQTLGWTHPYFVDADHIGFKNVDGFVDASDFFTLDVADAIGRTAPAETVNALVKHLSPYIGALQLPGLDEPLKLEAATLHAAAHSYLAAVQEAARLYRHIAKARGARPFMVEVSMDEVNQPQSPADLLVILAALAAEKVPVRTIAPRFTGAFHKGVDYVGDPARFEREFDADAAVVAFAVRKFGLPPDLKLSVHSGSDKYAIYPAIRRVTRRRECGVHLKTAGTTWLEEAAGLAESGDAGLAIVKEVYAQAMTRFDEFCAPYAAVISIDRAQLPSPETVAQWEGRRFALALRHTHTACPEFNPNLRQLMHVGYKAAAEMGARYRDAVTAAETIVGAAVTRNLLERHIRPLFL